MPTDLPLSTRTTSAADSATVIPATDGDVWVKTTIPAIVRRIGHRVVAASDSYNKEYAHYICDGTADNADLAAAIAAAAEGDMIEMLPGTYNWAAEVTIPKGLTIFGHGKGTIIKPVAGFANNTNALKVFKSSTEPVGYAVLRDFAIMGNGVTYTNQVHAIDFCAYRSHMDNLFLSQLSGDGVVTRGATGWANYECSYNRMNVTGFGQYCVNSVSSTDQHWSNSDIHDAVTANLFGKLSSTIFDNVQFYGGTQNVGGTQTIRDVHINTSAFARFNACRFEHAQQELVFLDGGVSGGQALFTGCTWRNGSTQATNTYSQLRVTGGQLWNVFIDSTCFFYADAAGGQRPKYNLEFDSSLQQSRIDYPRFRDAATGPHTALGSGNGIRTTIGGQGLNAGDPNSTGNWYQNGQQGVRVWDSTNLKMWECTTPGTSAVWKALS